MKRIILVCSFMLLAFSSTWADDRCNANWPDTRKKMHELLKAAGCSSNYTLNECKENLGLIAAVGGATYGVAKFVGADSGSKIKLQTPKFCGLAKNTEPRRGLAGFFWQASWAKTCDASHLDLLNNFRGQLKAALEENDWNMIEKGREAIGQKYPKLSELTEEAYKTQAEINGTNGKNEWLRARWLDIQDKISAEIGYSKDQRGQWNGHPFYHHSSPLSPETAAKEKIFSALWRARQEGMMKASEEMRSSTAGFLQKAAAPLNPQLGHLQERATELRRILKDPGLPNYSPEKLAEVIDRAYKYFPALTRSSLSRTRSELAARYKIPSSWIGNAAENGAKMVMGKLAGRAMGGGVLGVIATAAEATPVACDTLGANEAASNWGVTMIEGVGGNCTYEIALNSTMIDFLEQDESVWKEEFASHPRFCEAVLKLHRQSFPPSRKGICEDKSLKSVAEQNGDSTQTFEWAGTGDLQMLTTKSKKRDEPTFSTRFSQGTLTAARVIPDATGIYSSKEIKDMWSNAGFQEYAFEEISEKDLRDEKAMAPEHAKGHAMKLVRSRLGPLLASAYELQGCCNGSLDKSDPRCEPVAGSTSLQDANRPGSQ